MATESLITPWEVRRYSPAGKDYPLGAIAQKVGFEEADLLYSCLGKTLYEWLLTNKTAYPDPAPVAWVSGTRYDEGAAVIRHECVFLSTLDCNHADPAEGTDDWAALQRFTVTGDTDATDAANELWTDYVRPLIAYRVYAATLDYTTRESGAGGLVVLTGDNSGRRSANKGEVNDVKTALLADIDKMLRALRRYLVAKHEDEGSDYPLPITDVLYGCETAVCNSPRKSRRIAFQ